jgi:hypothetical protein
MADSAAFALAIGGLKEVRVRPLYVWYHSTAAKPS